MADAVICASGKANKRDFRVSDHSFIDTVSCLVLFAPMCSVTSTISEFGVAFSKQSLMCFGRHPGVQIAFHFRSLLFLLGFIPRIVESPMSKAFVSSSGSIVTVISCSLCPDVTPASI